MTTIDHFISRTYLVQFGLVATALLYSLTELLWSKNVTLLTQGPKCLGNDDDYIDYEKLEDDDDDDQSNNDDALPRSILDRRLVEASGALPSIFPPLLNPLHLQ